MQHVPRPGAFRHALVAWSLLLCGAALACSPSANQTSGAVPSATASASSEGPGEGSLSGGQRLVDWVDEVEARAVVQPEAEAAPRAARGLTRGVGDAADRQLALGDAALGRNDWARGLEHYRRARKLLPTHPAPVVGIVDARFFALGIPLEFASAPKDKRLKELFGLLDHAQKLDPKFGPQALSRGRLLLVQGEAEAAGREFTLAEQRMPDSAEAASGLGISLLAQGDVDAALLKFERAAELAPTDAQQLSMLGAVLILKEQLPRAVQILERAQALAPDDARISGDLGTALLATGRVEAAITELERAHAMAPQKGTFMSNLGYAHYLQDDLVKAEQWCQRAVAAEPRLGSAWLNLGVVLAAKQDYVGAERAFQRAQSLDPTDPRPARNLRDLAELRKTLQ